MYETIAKTLYSAFKYLFLELIDFSQSNGNGNALLYSCNGNVMHYFKKIK